MKINSIIIDDEPLARKGLREYMEDVAFLQFAGEYDSPLKLMENNFSDIQLMFLDIQMPKLTGLDFLKNLQHHPLVIITTAYPQYALDGFELDVLDYLVKPISFNRFLKAAMKAKDFLETHGSNSPLATLPPKENDYIFIKADNRLVKLFYSDILFVEALQNYVTIYSKDKKYVTYLTFKGVEENLPAESFIKVHKSYIIQLNKIDGIEGNEIIIGQHHIPISRTSKDEVLQKILSGRFLKR
ncbi:LytR/AlgR family response regulator transcription factor [Foetidibacter luteolus]|uniref:LytR/AlgR family response regulator transcription factor n=1 Tax=Foetidibacter luteolus TaxID=2608880 RepID=UPI00129B1036|nr:LytTR family DNA-binding domain-containing protein [Foetidibacter luteolus]